MSGQHTGRSHIPLTDNGRRLGARLRERLSSYRFALVLTSPLSRANDTAVLAGLAGAEVTHDLREFDYGRYEGRTTPEIRGERPGWDLWRDGCPDGEHRVRKLDRSSPDALTAESARQPSHTSVRPPPEPRALARLVRVQKRARPACASPRPASRRAPELTGSALGAEVEMEQRYIWATTRRIKPGKLEDFERAWRPERHPDGMVGALAYWSEDGEEVTGVSLWDSTESCDRWRASEAEAHRREAMAPYVEEERESFYHGVEFKVPS